MGLRKMLVLLGLGGLAVAALTAYVLLVDVHAPTTEVALEERGLIFRYRDARNRTLRDVARRLEIRRGATTLAVEKAGPQRWRIVLPIQARADRSRVLAVFDAIAQLRVLSFPEAGDGPDPFDFQKESFTVRFWLGEARHELHVGRKLAGQNQWASERCIRVGGHPRALTVDNELFERLEKGLAAFRDRRVFDRDPEQALAVRIASGNDTVVLERDGTEWRLAAPVRDYAEPARVKQILGEAKALEAQAYVDETPTKLDERGLAKAQLVFEIKHPDGGLTTLLVGAKAGQEAKHLYARRQDEPAVFTIKEGFVAGVQAAVEALRLRRIANFNEHDVTAVAIRTPAGLCRVARAGPREPWRLTQPRDAQADPQAVGNFLGHLARIRVRRWLDDPDAKALEHLTRPEATITLSREPAGHTYARKQPPITFALSRPVDTDDGRGRYVQRQGQPFLLFVSTATLPEGAPAELKDSVQAVRAAARCVAKGYLNFLHRRIFRFAIDAAAELRIKRGAAEIVCEPRGESWTLVRPVELDAPNVPGILATLARLEADEFVADRPATLQPYALDPPEVTLTVTLKTPGGAAGSVTRTLLVGRPVDGMTYAKVSDGPLVFLLARWRAAFLRNEPIATRLATLAREEAVALTIAHRGKPPIVLQRAAEAWTIAQPEKAQPDPAAVRSAIDALCSLLAVRCLDYDADAEALRAAGLDPPAVTVRVTLRGKPDLVLHLGRPVAGQPSVPGVYARRGDARQLFLLPTRKAAAIAPSLAGLKKKPEPPPDVPGPEEPK